MKIPVAFLVLSLGVVLGLGQARTESPAQVATSEILELAGSVSPAEATELLCRKLAEKGLSDRPDRIHREAAERIIALRNAPDAFETIEARKLAQPIYDDLIAMLLAPNRLQRQSQEKEGPRSRRDQLDCELLVAEWWETFNGWVLPHLAEYISCETFLNTRNEPRRDCDRERHDYQRYLTNLPPLADLAWCREQGYTGFRGPQTP